MTPDTQKLRNELGQQAHTIARLIEQRAQMHSDLIGQREAMKRAIEHLDRGELRQALAELDDELQRRERTRDQRKGRAA